MENNLRGEVDIFETQRASWMDMYVVYSCVLGTIAFFTGALHNNPMLAVWGIWTFCAIAYFARDRRTWCYKSDFAVIALSLPVATQTKNGMFQELAWVQIVIHVWLLLRFVFRTQMPPFDEQTPAETVLSDTDSECVEM
tara:strand:+ start:29868 stop:30284 length:417 start_codon:yes stop_codon:yes gene_type:complete